MEATLTFANYPPNIKCDGTSCHGRSVDLARMLYRGHNITIEVRSSYADAMANTTSGNVPFCVFCQDVNKSWISTATTESEVYAMHYLPPQETVVTDFRNDISVVGILFLFYVINRALKQNRTILRRFVLPISLFALLAPLLFRTYVKAVLLAKSVQTLPLPADDIKGIFRLLAYENYTLILGSDEIGGENEYHSMAEHYLEDYSARVKHLRFVYNADTNTKFKLLQPGGKEITQVLVYETGSTTGFESRANATNIGTITESTRPCCYAVHVQRDLRHIIQIRTLRAVENGLKNSLYVKTQVKAERLKVLRKIKLSSTMTILYICVAVCLLDALWVLGRRWKMNW